MGCLLKTCAILTVLTAVCIGIFLHLDQQEPENPPRYNNPNWGNKNKNDTSVKKLTVTAGEEAFNRLKIKLTNYRKAIPTLQDVNYTYGLPSAVLDKLVKYWINEYDWVKQETELNSLPQYTTIIHGLKVHFLHVRAQNIPKNIKR